MLEKINSAEDIKKLNTEEKKKLAEEIRKYIIDIVSENGGHLASNLGVVELTIALHSVFDLPKDKIIWDVGHQTYVHKIITGRREKLKTLRKLDGIAGFPKIKESIELIDSAENDILTLQGKGKLNLNIAASQNMVKTFLMPYLENFYKIYPNINIKIFTESPSEVIKKAQLGLIDIVFMNLPYKLPKEFETIKLVNLRCCLIANNEYYKL